MLCKCGRTHTPETADIMIGFGALASLSGLAAKYDPTGGPIFLISDENCYSAAGKKVLSALNSAGSRGPDITELVLTGGTPAGGAESVLPDERSLGRVFAECPPDAGLILAVGSGTVNDLARFAASRLRIPYIAAATAPSMDGYASGVSALLIGGFKSTYTAVPPAAIVGDAEILSATPAIMYSAGFGDIMGKYTSLNDWRLGGLIFGEYHCGYIEGLVKEAVEKCAANPSDAASLMEALCLSGVAMSYAGSSRPASGAEHHLSHFWEMKFIAENRPDPLHGLKVGVATLVMLRLREMLREEEGGSGQSGGCGQAGGSEQSDGSGRPDAAPTELPAIFGRAREKARNFDFAAYEDKIREIYGRNAKKIIDAEITERQLENVEKRIDNYQAKWDSILIELGSTPPMDSVKKMLQNAGAPVSPQELGVTRREFIDGIVYAKEIRQRFTILRLLADLGVLEEYAELLAAEFGYS
ncbi:MAG: sn-glycerol-1-phosphate dehydrogenase [Defluviitaleaceae bacterium]|nr:sn-glycerol-1-phosphate dehydrogenase [Defluviitaleaceae bacterium]